MTKRLNMTGKLSNKDQTDTNTTMSKVLLTSVDVFSFFKLANFFFQRDIVALNKMQLKKA